MRQKQDKLTIEEIAIKAKEYSRKCILAGSTWLENNSFSQDKKIMRSKAIVDTRELISENFFRLESNDLLAYFEKKLEIHKRYSIGNCQELALTALEYMILYYPKINAEVFYIEGGDHAFLVIGRKKKSQSDNPNT